MINRLLFLLMLCSISLIGFSQNETNMLRDNANGNNTITQLKNLITGNVVLKGQHVPDFVINIETEKSINISDYKGSIVLINFFATWCLPCNFEMSLLQNKVWLKYKDNNKFKLLSIGIGHTLDEVTKFKISNNFDFPIYPDKDKSIYNKFATVYIPRNYIIDSKGEIVYMSVGFYDTEFDNMLILLQHLLKE